MPRDDCVDSVNNVNPLLLPFAETCLKFEGYTSKLMARNLPFLLQVCLYVHGCVLRDNCSNLHAYIDTHFKCKGNHLWFLLLYIVCESPLFASTSASSPRSCTKTLGGTLHHPIGKSDGKSSVKNVQMRLP
jgi:hypothetical protein